jgi:hypothetical protein
MKKADVRIGRAIATGKPAHPIGDRYPDPHLNETASRFIIRFTRNQLRNLKKQCLFLEIAQLHQPGQLVLPAVELIIQEIVHYP